MNDDHLTPQESLEDLQWRVAALEHGQDRTRQMSIAAYVKGLAMEDRFNHRKAPMAIHMLIAILPVVAVTIGAVYGWWWPLVWWTCGKSTIDVTEFALRKPPRRD